MTVRTLTEADFPAAMRLDASAFGFDLTPEIIEGVGLPVLRSGRMIGAFEDERMVGTGLILDKQVTVPGGAAVPFAAVTWVSVSPDRGGRGLLRELMRHQLHGLHDSAGQAIAALTASESGIYGRFGYGMAVEGATAEIVTPTGLRPGLVVEPVVELPREQAMPVVHQLYERIRPTRVGYLSRDETTWSALFGEISLPGRPGGSLRVALHPDGFAAFRIEDGHDRRGPRQVLHIVELGAATPAAAAALWAHLLRRPLARTVRYARFGPGEVLRDLLVEPRAAGLSTADHIWLRLVDVDRALRLRRYRRDVRAVLRVRDEFCPWNDGTWLFEVRDGAGSAVRTAEPADVELDMAELGAAFLGGQPLARMAAAGLVVGDPALVEALDGAFLEHRPPYCPEGF